MRRTLILLAATAFCFTASASLAQKKRSKKKPLSAASDNSAAPDKILYDRALSDIKHGRQEVGRLTLQTLINTYPDSEYLAKAKLSIADSFYKEGGTANLAQAISSYKDFIVFFPFLSEAAYAQIQVGMAHYKQLEKPDRDRTEARAAEEEFQTFLQKYPNDPLAPQAEQKLRDVQEMLAEGDYRIAYYYYVKGSYRAAAGRLLTISNRYPLYSKSDHSLWMLGNIFEKSERKDVAAEYYAKIVKEYPLSAMSSAAKRRLTALGKAVPPPDPQALAWMQKELSVRRGHSSVVHKATGILQHGPDVRTAARYGKPNMEPESESAGEILTPGGQSRLGGPSASGTVTAPVVEVVTPGVSAGKPSGTPSDGAAPASGQQPPPDPPGGAAENPAAPAQTSESDAAASASTAEKPADAAAQPAGAAPAEGAASEAAKSDSTKGSAPASDTAQTPDAAKADDKAQPSDDKKGEKKKESTSKKKKGLKKIVPW